MKKTLILAGALISAAALSLASCAQAPGTGGSSAAPSASGSASASGAAFKACMVSDSGGFDDKSFNQTSYKGLTDAKAELGIETGQVESQRCGRLREEHSVDGGCELQHHRHCRLPPQR